MLVGRNEQYIAAKTVVPLRWLGRQAAQHRGKCRHLFPASSVVALEDLTTAAAVTRQLRMRGGRGHEMSC